MNGFSPLNQLRSSSKGLELDYHEQQHLSRRIRRTEEDLAHVPSITPDQTDVTLDHIPILGADGRMSRENQMGLFYSESNDGRFSATIRLSESGFAPYQLQLNPAGNIWGEWRSRSSGPSSYLENSSLVSLLSTRLKNGEFLESMLDARTLDAMEIVRVLAMHLKSQARGMEKFTRYSTVGSLRQTDFLSSNEASLSAKETHRKRIHQLAVGAVYSVGGPLIRKQYSYSTTSTGTSVSGEGSITVSSQDGIPQNHLAHYAEIDQDDNYPLETLHSGLSRLRQHYRLHRDDR